MGPLKGVKVIEMGGIGPSPFCCMMLSDMGAEVIRVEKNNENMFTDHQFDLMLRGRRSIVLNVATKRGKKILYRLLEDADILIEGFRPGKMEALGLSPDELLSRFPKLIYGRMTGWGQDGPLSRTAGHDINYIAISGALHAMGSPDAPPTPPLNLVGDFGAGGALLAVGVLSALYERETSGTGQVIDAAMCDGSALLMSMIYGMRMQGFWSENRGANFIDGGAHFYGVYETSDHKYVCIGAIEPQFYKELLRYANIDEPEFLEQWNPEKWPKLKEKLKVIFKKKTREEWRHVFKDKDACFSPVLTLDEAPSNPHYIARKTFTDVNGIAHPSPVPRFSRTPSEINGPPSENGAHTHEILSGLGFDEEDINTLKTDGVIK